MGLSQSEINELLPEKALELKLPIIDVVKRKEFNFDNDLMVATSTASGKSIIFTALDAMLHPEKRFYLREPSRLTAHSLYNGYKTFFEDRLSFGIMTSVLKENTDAQLIFVSDGILSQVFRKQSHLEHSIIIEDECHSLIGQTEIELSLIKREINRRLKEGNTDPFIRILSATIDPVQLSKYLGINKEDVHTLSESNFKVNKSVVNSKNISFNKYLDNEFIPKLINKNRNGLVFVPTRANTEEYKNLFGNKIKTEFIHAGESSNKLEQVMNENQINPEPLLVFGTVAMAMGITANFDDTLIYDERIDSNMKKGVECIFRRPCDDNTLIQMLGRIARFKDGDAVLFTNNHKSWDNIEPRSVELPLEKITPYNIMMLMAQYGINNISEIDLLSDIDINELNYAKKYLEDRDVIDYIDGILGLTKRGRMVQMLPLDVKMSVIISHASPELVPLFVSAFASGFDNIWKFIGKYKKDGKFITYPLDKRYYNEKSEFLSKSKIIQDAFKVRNKGRGELNKWCLFKRLDYKYISSVLQRFGNIEKSMKRKYRDRLVEMNLDEYSDEFVKTLIKANVFPIVNFKRNRNSNSLVSMHDGVYTILTNETEKLLGLQNNERVTIMGNLIQIISQKRNTINLMSTGTIIK